MHALQALHHHCGVDESGNRAPAWDDKWGEVASFSGSRDAWDALCQGSTSFAAKEIARSFTPVTCDWTGRVLSINIDTDSHGVKLDCPHGLPTEFGALSELVALRVAGALRFTEGGAEISEIMSPLASLRWLAVVSLPSNGLKGRVPDVCDTHTGYAFDSALERLELSDNELTGALPGDGLKCATHMRRLDVSYNDLTGVLPDVWADSMHQLRELRFNNNPRLTGSLPTAWFPPLSENESGSSAVEYRFSNLKELDGTDCDLTGALPANLGGASSLETLRLGGNRIEGSVPGSVTRLTQLRELNLRRNKLSGALPANLFVALADTLHTVNLAHNALSGAPPPFPSSGYPVLRDVDLSENDFEGPFESFGAVSLLFLSVAHNGFVGSFPDPCGNVFMNHLEIQGNAFTGAFPDITCMRRLTFLDASANAFDALAGDGGWIANPNNRVSTIDFRANALRGNLPSSGICGRYTRRIDLSGNALAGAIPESVGECTSLRELRLGEFVDLDEFDDTVSMHDSENVSMHDSENADAFSFSLPSEATLAKLTRLTHLHLRGIGLTGAIPRSLFALPSLLELDLSHNRLSGALPADAEGGAWSATLHRLSLSRNNLTGVVPSSLLALKSLQKLYLAENGFEGVEAFPEPPPEPIETTDASANETDAETRTQTETDDEPPLETFSFAAYLDRLDLSSNAIPFFPAALERVGGLTMLSLANNGMGGLVPAWLGERDTLVHLRLDGNALRGSLEDWLGNNRLLDLESLRVDGNAGITGPLSSGAIRPMARLKRLNVSAIGAFGAFPHALGVPGASLDALTHLHARNSGLNGTLPASLFAALPNLRTLDLRENALAGDVPDGASFEGETSPSPSSGALRHHASLTTLLLANNSFTGAFPRLSETLESLAEDRRNAFGLEHMRDTVVDLRGAGDETNGSFACPLPLDAAAYADAECTCPAGSAGADQGRFECDLCVPGSYSAQPGAPVCDLCPVGRFADKVGSVACDFCAPGSAAPATGSAACDLCAPGFFAALRGSPTCDACDPGTFAGEEGSVACAPCPVGAAADEPASATCARCAPGTFAEAPRHDGVGSSLCAQCAPGTFSDAEGSTTCSACAPGHVAREEGSSTCVRCDEGSFASNGGASTCVPCAAGSFASERGATSCDACAAGFFSAAEGGATCDACPVGTFGAEEGKASCESCPLGTFADREGSTVCSKCAPGAFADAQGSATCRECARGAFQENEGASTCVSCAAGTFADTEGSESCAPCPLGTFADEPGTEQCAPCAVGSFANEEGAEFCAPCPAGSAAAVEASAACGLCAPGTFQNETGAETCARCPVGTVSSSAASQTCELCPAGSFSDQTGLTKCTPCLPGSAANEGAGTCVPCAVGFFASSAEAATCSACPKGTFQNSTGQASCVLCPAGTASDAERAGDAGTCVSCPAGTSTDGKEGAATCADCDAGAYAAAGAESCSLASPGAVASVAGAAEQTPCPPGTHAPGRGNTECLPCPENHAAPARGAATCFSCPPGSESPEGAAACVCAAGYRDATDLFASSDLFFDEENSSDASRSSLATPVCLACEPGTYGDGGDRCATCPPDQFSSSNATAACENIAPGFVGSDFVEPTTMRGARAQTPCPAGSRSRDALVGLTLAPQCEACPEGTIAPLEGSDTCAACAPGFEPDATRTLCVGADGYSQYANGSFSGGSSSGGSSSSSGGSSSEDDDYAGLSDADLAAFASREDEKKAAGAMSAKTSAAAFFALLGVCALSLFFVLRWWRARNARLRRLAFEREMALDAAEEDIAETGKIRRSTLFALANVDAEATAYGEDLRGFAGSRGADGRDDRRGPRLFSPLARLNLFGGFGGRDRGDFKKKRGAEYRYSAARVARAASGVLPADAHPCASARMSVARVHADRLDRLERLSRVSRGASLPRALPRKGSRFEPRRRRLGVSDDSDSDSDAERLDERLNDAPASSDDRSRDDEEAAFESAVLAAARRASRFERDRRDRRRDESRRATRHKTVSRDDDDDDDAARDDRRRLLDAPSLGSGDRPTGVGAADASAHAALLSDVIVDTAERGDGETAKRRWKMFRGNGDSKP